MQKPNQRQNKAEYTVRRYDRKNKHSRKYMFVARAALYVHGHGETKQKKHGARWVVVKQSKVFVVAKLNATGCGS